MDRRIKDLAHDKAFANIYTLDADISRLKQEIQRLKDLAEARENSDAYRRGLPDRPRT